MSTPRTHIPITHAEWSIGFGLTPVVYDVDTIRMAYASGIEVRALAEARRHVEEPHP